MIRILIDPRRALLEGPEALKKVSGGALVARARVCVTFVTSMLPCTPPACIRVRGSYLQQPPFAAAVLSPFSSTPGVAGAELPPLSFVYSITSRARASNAISTLWFVLALVSKKGMPYCFAISSPCSYATFFASPSKSYLLATSTVRTSASAFCGGRRRAAVEVGRDIEDTSERWDNERGKVEMAHIARGS